MKKSMLFWKQRLLSCFTALIIAAGMFSPVSAITVNPIVPIVPIDPVIIIKPINLDYNYEIVNGSAIITDYLGSGGNITIPSTLGGYPVTEIKHQAFEATGSLTGVVIPDSVMKIGYNAFANCTNLSSVSLPKYLTVISDELFYGCNSLTGITIPESVTIIKPAAFSNTSLTVLNIPKNVTDISVSYTEMKKLTSINVDPLNTIYSSVDGVLYSKDKKDLLKYPEAKADLSFIVPNGVTAIHYQAFRRCSLLQYVTIPASVTWVGDSFAYSSSLKTAVFQGSGTKLGEYCFYYCTALTNVTLPSGLKILPANAFSNCAGLKSINLPSTVASIGKEAFKGCINLSSITMPPALTEIGSLAFYGCKALPAINIPSGVKLINNSAFYGCSNLSSVTIPSTVTTMGAFGFKNCSNLLSARFQGDAPKIGKELFANTSAGFLIYFPMGAEGWTTPTWYGYPTQAYTSFANIPLIPLRQIPTFSIPKIPTEDSIEFRGPILKLPTWSLDVVPDLLEPGTIPAPVLPTPQENTVIKLYLNNSVYMVNGESKMMDTSPVLLNNRILLPVRYVSEPLGAVPVWDPNTQKVTVTLGTTVLELWVGNNTARINGVEKMIDPNNPDVKPIIVPPGRTMLPVRFLGESLGCEVLWNQDLSEATLTRIK